MHRGAITVFCVEGEVLNDVVHFLDGFVGAEPRAGGPLGFGGCSLVFPDGLDYEAFDGYFLDVAVVGHSD